MRISLDLLTELAEGGDTEAEFYIRVWEQENREIADRKINSKDNTECLYLGEINAYAIHLPSSVPKLPTVGSYSIVNGVEKFMSLGGNEYFDKKYLPSPLDNLKRNV
jgi:hypothetical protein